VCTALQLLLILTTLPCYHYNTTHTHNNSAALDGTVFGLALEGLDEAAVAATAAAQRPVDATLAKLAGSCSEPIETLAQPCWRDEEVGVLPTASNCYCNCHS
jgi:hypothetical protein